MIEQNRPGLSYLWVLLVLLVVPLSRLALTGWTGLVVARGPLFAVIMIYGILYARRHSGY